jgi:adenylate cyclase
VKTAGKGGFSAGKKLTAGQRLGIVLSLRAVAISVAISFLFLLTTGFSLDRILLLTVIFGVPFGVVISLLSITKLTTVKFPSFIVTVTFRTVVFVVAAMMSFSTSFYLTAVVQYRRTFLDPRNARDAQEMISAPAFATAIGFTMLAIFLVSCILSISQKLGPGVMWNWLIGHYHQPREEDRFFMFLDMKDSTGLAERLGNLKFSALVRDFMDDLTHPVMNTRGEVSHYIGDEAVLTWRKERGSRNANVVRCFWLMRDQIERRANHYRERYGVVPEFKAGIHYGRVVATEVGRLKSEIVFHGDVLNSTARIQSLCGFENAELLISDDARQLLNSPSVHAVKLGLREIKGRQEPIEIWRVDRPSPAWDQDLT